MDGQLTREEVYSPPSVEEAMGFGAFSAASLVAVCDKVGLAYNQGVAQL